MEADRPRMVSLPGDSASSDCVVTTPYVTANSAQTTATSAPWSDRKLDKRYLSGLRQKRNGSPSGPPWSAGSLPRPLSLLTRYPEAPGALRRAGAAALGIGRGLLLRGRRGRRGSATRQLHVGHLQARERVLDRRELLAVAGLQQRQQGARALDRLARLPQVALRRLLAGRRGQPRLAGAQVDQGDQRLQQHVVDAELVHLGLDRPQLLLAQLSVQGTFSSAVYVARVSSTAAL